MIHQTAFEEDFFQPRLTYDWPSNNVSFSSSPMVDSPEFRTGTSVYPLDEVSGIMISPYWKMKWSNIGYPKFTIVVRYVHSWHLWWSHVFLVVSRRGNGWESGACAKVPTDRETSICSQHRVCVKFTMYCLSKHTWWWIWASEGMASCSFSSLLYPPSFTPRIPARRLKAMWNRGENKVRIDWRKPVIGNSD